MKYKSLISNYQVLFEELQKMLSSGLSIIRCQTLPVKILK